MRKVIVVVHGMGEERQFEMSRITAEIMEKACGAKASPKDTTKDNAKGSRNSMEKSDFFLAGSANEGSEAKLVQCRQIKLHKLSAEDQSHSDLLYAKTMARTNQLEESGIGRDSRGHKSTDSFPLPGSTEESHSPSSSPSSKSPGSPEEELDHGYRHEDFAIHEIHWSNLAKDFNRPKIFDFFNSTMFSSMGMKFANKGKKFVYFTVMFLLTKILGSICKLINLIPKPFRIVDPIQIYTDFLGDVELYARGDVDDLDYIFGGRDHVYHHVNHRFDKGMERVAHSFDEIHIIAHSLGSVLVLNRMINAAIIGTDNPGHWIKKTKSFITMGSPIDKFAAMFSQTLVPVFLPKKKIVEKPITWYNINASWDPTGSKMDYLFKAVPWLEENLIQRPRESFFVGKKFRAWVPALAHISYWYDVSMWKKLCLVLQHPGTEVPKVMGEGKKLLSFITWIPIVLNTLLVGGAVLAWGMLNFIGYKIGLPVTLFFLMTLYLVVVQAISTAIVYKGHQAE